MHLLRNDSQCSCHADHLGAHIALIDLACASLHENSFAGKANNEKYSLACVTWWAVAPALRWLSRDNQTVAASVLLFIVATVGIDIKHESDS